MSLAVPVLPAAGRPMLAAYPVPDWITPWSAEVTSSASFESRTRCALDRTSPIGSSPPVIFTSGVAQRRTPPASIVA